MKFVLYRENMDYVYDSAFVVIDSDIKDKSIFNGFKERFFPDYSLVMTVENYNTIDLDTVDIYKVEEIKYLTFTNLLEKYNEEIAIYDLSCFKSCEDEHINSIILQDLIKKEKDSLYSKIYLRIPLVLYSSYSESQKLSIIEEGYIQIKNKGGNARFMRIDKDLIEHEINEKINDLELELKDCSLKIKESKKVFSDLNIRPLKPEFTLEKIS